MKENTNLYTASITGAYDFMIGSVTAFSMVYLLANNLSEALIGNLIAGANLLAVLTQPLLASWADRSRKWSVYHFIQVLTAVILLALFLLLILRDHFILVAATYLLSLGLLSMLLPFHNAFIMSLLNAGYQVNFGLTRAVGSFSFAVTSSLVGYWVTQMGEQAIIYVALIGAICYLFANWRLYHKFKKDLEPAGREVSSQNFHFQEESITQSFWRRYPQFIWLMVGTLGLFISHNIANLFVYQIVAGVGGGASEMGLAIALAAVVEVPVMVYYSRLTRRYHHSQLLKLSSWGFMLKALLTLLASSVAGVYFAHLFQTISFGLYIVACVYYTDALMGGQDKVKGQSYLAMMQTMGGILAGSVGGWLLDLYGLKCLLIFSLVGTLVGVVCFHRGLQNH
ncbi:MFS transporter [Hutsoniella sourekii]